MAVIVQSLPHAGVVKQKPYISGLGASPACGDATSKTCLLRPSITGYTQKRFLGSWGLYLSTLGQGWVSNGEGMVHKASAGGKQKGVCMAWTEQSANGVSHKRSGQSARKKAVVFATGVLERQELTGIPSDSEHANGVADRSQHRNGVELKSQQENGAGFESEQANGVALESQHGNGVAFESQHANGAALESQHVNGDPFKGQQANGVAFEGQQADGVAVNSQQANGVMSESQQANGVASGSNRCKLTNRIANDGQQRCAECKCVKALVDFQKSGKGRRKDCRACVAYELAKRSGKKMYHMTMTAEEAWVRAKACTNCGVVKELRDFAPSKSNSHAPHPRCRACNYALANNNRHVLEAASVLRELLEAKQRKNICSRQCEELSATLEEALSSKAELEEKVEFLSTAVAEAEEEERIFRDSQPELERQVSNLALEHTELQRAKKESSEILAEKEQQRLELEEAVIRSRKEVATLLLQLADAQAVQSQVDNQEPDTAEDLSANQPHQLADAQAVQSRADNQELEPKDVSANQLQQLPDAQEAANLLLELPDAQAVLSPDDYQKPDKEPEAEDSSVGTQLAEMASLAAAVQREKDEVVEALVADPRVEDVVADAQTADEIAEAIAEVMEEAQHESFWAKPRIMAGASVLLSSVLGLYILSESSLSVPTFRLPGTPPAETVQPAAPPGALSEPSEPSPVKEAAKVTEPGTITEETVQPAVARGVLPGPSEPSPMKEAAKVTGPGTITKEPVQPSAARGVLPGTNEPSPVKEAAKAAEPGTTTGEPVQLAAARGVLPGANEPSLLTKAATPYTNTGEPIGVAAARKVLPAPVEPSFFEAAKKAAGEVLGMVGAVPAETAQPAAARGVLPGPNEPGPVKEAAKANDPGKVTGRGEGPLVDVFDAVAPPQDASRGSLPPPFFDPDEPPPDCAATMC